MSDYKMMTVKTLARCADVTTDSVRYYVRIGLLTPDRDAHNGYKLFSNADIQRVRFIRQAKLLGYTLNDIREIFHHSAQGRSPCHRVRELMEERIDLNRKRVAELNALLKRMETALGHWQTMPNSTPDGDSICHLIESESNDSYPA